MGTESEDADWELLEEGCTEISIDDDVEGVLGMEHAESGIDDAGERALGWMEIWNGHAGVSWMAEWDVVEDNP